MSIPKVIEIQDWNTAKHALDHIYREALGTTFYNTTMVSLVDVPIGKLVIIDDGTNTRVGMRTGLNRLAWWGTNSVSDSGTTVGTTIYMTGSSVVIVSSPGGTTDTYWSYNSATDYLECWVKGNKRMEL